MKLLVLFIFLTNLYADVKQDMFNFYQNKQYSKACTIGFNYFKRYKRDEAYASLYGFSCLNSDYIDRLAEPITVLKFSKDARANAAYFSIILMQKKLLYHALLDNYPLSKLKLPTTDYVLSKVFDLYAQLGKHKKRTFYLFKDKKDKKLTYKLYLIKDNDISKMVVEEIYDTMLLKRHIYW
jgi:hypothetical protein